MKSTIQLSYCLFLVLFVVACAQNATQVDGYDEKAASDQIWAMEQAIYAARAKANMQVYVDSASEAYMGWPPGWEAPSGLDRLRDAIEQFKGRQGIDQERLTMEFGDITFSGSTAIIYYKTHRTRTPTGEAVDQRFEVVHVWVREQDEWKLLGALGRNAAPSS